MDFAGAIDRHMAAGEAVSDAGERSSIIKADKKGGKLVGPYLVGEVIGEDSMAVVRKIEASKTDGRDKPETEVKIAKSGELKEEAADSA